MTEKQKRLLIKWAEIVFKGKDLKFETSVLKLFNDQDKHGKIDMLNEAKMLVKNNISSTNGKSPSHTKI